MSAAGTAPPSPTINDRRSARFRAALACLELSAGTAAQPRAWSQVVKILRHILDHDRDIDGDVAIAPLTPLPARMMAAGDGRVPVVLMDRVKGVIVGGAIGCTLGLATSRYSAEQAVAMVECSQFCCRTVGGVAERRSKNAVWRQRAVVSGRLASIQGGVTHWPTACPGFPTLILTRRGVQCAKGHSHRHVALWRCVGPLAVLVPSERRWSDHFAHRLDRRLRHPAALHALVRALFCQCTLARTDSRHV